MSSIRATAPFSPARSDPFRVARAVSCGQRSFADAHTAGPEQARNLRKPLPFFKRELRPARKLAGREPQPLTKGGQPQTPSYG